MHFTVYLTVKLHRSFNFNFTSIYNSARFICMQKFIYSRYPQVILCLIICEIKSRRVKKGFLNIATIIVNQFYNPIYRILSLLFWLVYSSSFVINFKKAEF